MRRRQDDKNNDMFLSFERSPITGILSKERSGAGPIRSERHVQTSSRILQVASLKQGFHISFKVINQTVGDIFANLRSGIDKLCCPCFQYIATLHTDKRVCPCHPIVLKSLKFLNIELRRLKPTATIICDIRLSNPGDVTLANPISL